MERTKWPLETTVDGTWCMGIGGALCSTGGGLTHAQVHSDVQHRHQGFARSRPGQRATGIHSKEAWVYWYKVGLHADLCDTGYDMTLVGNLPRVHNGLVAPFYQLALTLFFFFHSSFFTPHQPARIPRLHSHPRTPRHRGTRSWTLHTRPRSSSSNHLSRLCM